MVSLRWHSRAPTPDAPWTVTSTAPWVSVTPAGGQGSTVVTLTAVRNLLGTSRTAAVAVGGQQLFLTQEAGGVTFAAVGGGFRRYFAEGVVIFRLDLQAYQVTPFFDARSRCSTRPTRLASALMRFQRSDGVVVTYPVTLPLAATDRRSARGAGLTDWVIIGVGLFRPISEFSTVVESNVPVFVDRTMKWDGTGYGSHSETGIGSPGTVWYLAEGATLGGFNLFYLVHNPNEEGALVQVRYLLPAPQAPVVKAYTVAGHTRLTIWVNQEDSRLAAAEMSAVIASQNAVPVIVERAMYLDGDGRAFNAGHESAGASGSGDEVVLRRGRHRELLRLLHFSWPTRGRAMPR